MAEDILYICAEEYTKERRAIPTPSTYQAIKKATAQYIEKNKDCLNGNDNVLFQLIKMPEMETKPVKVMVSFPKNVLEQIDKKAEKLGMTRSGFLANSALAYE